MTTVFEMPVGSGAVASTVPVNGQQTNVNNGSSGEIDQKPEPMPLDVSISNVVCSFSTKCHLNLKRIAMEGSNVEYHRQHGVRPLFCCETLFIIS